MIYITVMATQKHTPRLAICAPKRHERQRHYGHRRRF